MKYGFLPDFSIIRSSDEKSEDLNSFFPKLLTSEEINDLNCDKYSSIELKEESEMNFFPFKISSFFNEEREDNNFFSSEDSNSKTSYKTKEKIKKDEFGNKFNEHFSDEIEKSFYDYQNIMNDNMNKINDSLNIIIQQNQQEEKKECESVLGRKRDLFKKDSPNNFSIFNCGQDNDCSRKLINDILNSYEYKKNLHQKNVLTRKENSDNIRKKIKARFLKALKNAMNQRLKLAGSGKLFKFLPQAFICNVSKQKNKAVLNLSLKELFEKNLCEGEKPKDLKNYYHNLSVLEYLEKNHDIGEKSNYNNFKNMKYYQIFNEYLKSKEFEMEIASLKQEKENDKYIKHYIIKANNFLNFFNN